MTGVNFTSEITVLNGVSLTCKGQSGMGVVYSTPVCPTKTCVYPTIIFLILIFYFCFSAVLIVKLPANTWYQSVQWRYDVDSNSTIASRYICDKFQMCLSQMVYFKCRVKIELTDSTFNAASLSAPLLLSSEQMS